MCDVCDSEGRDFAFYNGKSRDYLQTVRLYRVYIGQEARIKMCHLHAIEVFCVGEQRFLESHRNLAIALSTNKKDYVHSSSIGF